MSKDYDPFDRPLEMLPCKDCKKNGTEGTFAWRRKQVGSNYSPSWDLLHWHGYSSTNHITTADPTPDAGLTLYGYQDNKSHVLEIWNKKNRIITETKKKLKKGTDFLLKLVLTILFVIGFGSMILDWLSGKAPPHLLPEGTYTTE
ncbi:hypothetical protein [Roseobacter ponti]|uniref:Uncharacterized protein n=1 Tax=Roseobacter ponti TaxID=1891787 RepID=A0A858SPJ1_9RHOB|nr:hypothetical protein [Roseobacter ponti]QJF50759.1 hypothetical protein G3256_06115 [Roseobacter ponti]